jgi:hypothetical protein
MLLCPEERIRKKLVLKNATSLHCFLNGQAFISGANWKSQFIRVKLSDNNMTIILMNFPTDCQTLKMGIGLAISPTFYTQLLCQFPSTKKLQSHIKSK